LRLAGAISQATEQLDPELRALIEERETARKEKDFARADALREELRSRGVVVEDTASGTKWKLV
jgi:cysteinyl-tRNA synthetase